MFWIVVFANFLGINIPTMARINPHDITEHGLGKTCTAHPGIQNFHQI